MTLKTMRSLMIQGKKNKIIWHKLICKSGNKCKIYKKWLKILIITFCAKFWSKDKTLIKRMIRLIARLSIRIFWMKNCKEIKSYFLKPKNLAISFTGPLDSEASLIRLNIKKSHTLTVVLLLIICQLRLVQETSESLEASN